MAEKASKEEQVGFHKGALSTLAKEREEMLRVLNIIEQLMKMHLGSLRELGVEIKPGSVPEQKLDEKLKR
jgi:hypothetical protein